MRTWLVIITAMYGKELNNERFSGLWSAYFTVIITLNNIFGGQESALSGYL